MLHKSVLKVLNDILKKIVICVSRPKSASFSSEWEFSGRGAAEAPNRRRQKALKKLQIYFVSIFLKYVDKFINRYFLYCIFISLPKKREIYYLDNLWRQDSFIGFVANLLDRPADATTVSVRKSASEKELLFVRLRVRTVPKMYSKGFFFFASPFAS
jgi:hypothetical protein